jgi:hypothetical protein
MSISEKRHVENPCVKEAKNLGVRVLKLNTMGNRSWPDRCFWIPGGKPLIIEFKKPGEKPTPLQRDTIDYLIRIGYDVHVIDTKEQGIALIRDRLAAARVHEASGEVARGARRRRTVP